MVKTKAEVAKIIREFVASLKKDIRVESVILYGSYAKNSPKPHSDIDILVVSRDFRKKKYLENMQYLFRKAARTNSLIEPLPVTPDEVRQCKKDAFLSSILKKGKFVSIKNSSLS